VTSLSTVETSLASFHRCCTLRSWGPLHSLIPSIWALKEVGAWNHLSLWGDTSLSRWLRHRLKTRWDRVEDRSSRCRTDAGHGVGALLSQMLLLAPVCHYSSPIFEHKSLFYHGLKIVKVTCFQSISKSIIQTVEETLLLLLVGVHIIGSIAGKLYEMNGILTHHHGSFLRIKELLLKLDNTP
jgi:hypothetical protein